MANFDFISHATISGRGTSIFVSIYRTNTPKATSTNDLVSRYDAVVTQINVFGGMAVASVGQPVRAGEVLVRAAFQVGVEVGEPDDWGRPTYTPITQPTTASAVVFGRVSHSRATVVQGEVNIPNATVVLMAQIMNDNNIIDYEATQTFTTPIGDGAYIIEVVVSVIRNLLQ